MGYAQRQKLLKELQELRGTKVVAHINSDRRVAEGLPALPGIITKLAAEAQPFFYEALRDLGKCDALDLFLYTGGGQTDSVWPLVSLFREHAPVFNVLVPFRAHSAGTLICLGANTVVLGEAAELSPVDPATGNQYNPVDEINPKMRRAISVEDVTAYFELAGNPTKKSNEESKTYPKVDIDLAFRLLAEKVHPLALGNVNRSHKQIRELAHRLLQLHIHDAKKAEGRISTIVNALTQGRYSHTDTLNRREAKGLLGDDAARFASESEQKLMWTLFEEYCVATDMLKTFVLPKELGSDPSKEMRTIGAFIETESSSFIYHSICRVSQRSSLPPGFQVQLQPGAPLPLIPGFPVEIHVDLAYMGWVENKEGV